MLKRLVAAVLEGALPGAAVAFGLSKLGTAAPFAMYLAVAVVGVLTGLVAGKPIWAKAAKIEALLKALAGAFIAVVVLYAVRKWLPGVQVDLASLGAGAGSIGNLPWVAFPATGVALATVLEIDDAFGADPTVPVRHRVDARADERAGVEPASEEQEDSDVVRARRRS
jgi:hypothetical protein